jgi:hypothetical protein
MFHRVLVVKSCPLTASTSTCESRRAVTKRASRIVIPISLFRRHDVAKLGQTCRAQSWAIDRMGSRSALVRPTDWPASTCGAKPGKAITETPRSDIIAKAANDLIILGAADFGRSLSLYAWGLTFNRQDDEKFHPRRVSDPE